MASIRRIDFDCPGCGARFHEPPAAAGKKTRCPRCAAEFVIPPGAPVRETTGNGRSEQRHRSRPAPAAADSHESEVVPDPDPRPRRQIITRATVLPIGFLLLTLGGLISIVGVLSTIRGYQQSLFGQMGSLGTQLGGNGDITGPVREYSRLVRELAAEPGQQPRDLNELPPNDGPPPPSPQVAPELGASSSGSGKALLYGGVIAGVLGSLLSFVGGIFVFAGLIGRFKFDEVTARSRHPGPPL